MIDICAAPFGTGFFISSWLAETRPEFPAVVRALIFMAYFPVFALSVQAFGLFMGPFIFFGLIIVGLLVVQANREADHNSEDFVMALPIIGRIYERFFKPDTYFAMDTALMFRDAVHNAVLEAVDGLTTHHGLRALSELERRPVSRGLFSEPRR